MSQKPNFTKQEKSLIAYAKKWMMPDDTLKTNIESKNVTIYCSQNEDTNFVLCLTVVIEHLKYVWEFNDDKSTWKQVQ